MPVLTFIPARIRLDPNMSTMEVRTLIFRLGNFSARDLALAAALGTVVLAVCFWLSYCLVSIALRDPRRCPACKSPRIRPSSPKLFERFLPRLYAFRCEACSNRFYVLSARIRTQVPADSRARAIKA